VASLRAGEQSNQRSFAIKRHERKETRGLSRVLTSRFHQRPGKKEGPSPKGESTRLILVNCYGSFTIGEGGYRTRVVYQERVLGRGLGKRKDCKRVFPMSLQVSAKGKPDKREGLLSGIQALAS